MKQLYYITGYYKDSPQDILENLLVSSYDSADNTYEEDNIFLYGYSEAELIEAISFGNDIHQDFVITKYQLVNQAI